jgi:putative hydrolase of the HAD superfamily
VSTKRAVLLDVGGVLLLPSHQAVEEALSRIGFEPETPRIDAAHYHAMSAADEAPSLEEVADWYWSGFATAVGVAEDQVPAAVEAFGAVFIPGSNAWTRPVADSVEALGGLRRAGLHVALVSNSDNILEAELRDLGICQVGPGAGAEVDAIIVSDVVGVEKPDHRIFEMALRTLGVQPSDAIHVGDSVRFDVQGASGAGVGAAHFDPFSVCPRRDHAHMASLHQLVENVSTG